MENSPPKQAVRKSPFEDLDWPALLEWAAKEARTPYGQQKMFELNYTEHFAQTETRAQELQNETSEIYALIEREALWGSLRGLQEVHDELESLSKGGVLEVQGLSRIRAWLYTVDSWLDFPKELAGRTFKNALDSLFNPQDCLRVIDRVLTPTGELSEKASSKLTSLLSQVRDLKKDIAQRMETLTQAYAAKGMLQEKYSDVRDGRYVLPVKVSEQSKVDGRIAELSVSKQTVFIEPKEVEALHAQLRRKEAEASEEIFTILTGVSKQIQPFVDQMGGAIEVISYWDAVQARARLAKRYGGKPIAVSDDRAFVLANTVHPLLFWNREESEIVRNTIEVTAPKQMILLSGPNTGGKTVLLKTLGLAAIAARTGFFYPGTGKLSVPYFDSFFVDLGDPQSIAEHVSSFSGHVIKMKTILETMGARSLILVDEMNSATDPEEGAALAQAFVQTILNLEGAMLIATTHDPQLKAMGMSDPRILNASILFDEASLKPTYKVVFGAPGRSRALETAERLGMPKAVLALAKTYLSQEHKQFETVLQQFQQELEFQESARRQAVQFKEDAERLKNEWEQKVQKTVEESIEKARQKLKHVLELAQIEVRETLKKIQSTKSHKHMDEIRRELNESFEHGQSRIENSILEAAPELAPALENAPPPVPASHAFERGVWVRVPKWKNVGEIIEWDGKKAKVALGAQQTTGMGKAFVVTVYAVEMEVLSERELKTVLGVRGGKTQKIKIQSEDVGVISESLDLRGQRLDEAMALLSNYIDRAFRSGRGEVTIIHGLGTGAIREGARALLKQTNFVTHFEDARTPGATLVRFTQHF